jgi:GGDEF domain-containing protein
LSEDHQHPPLAVSFGAAVYPGSGTFEDLFAAADNALYAMKIQSPHGQILKYPAYVDSQQA